MYRLAAICAFLSVITTIGIHSFITGPSTLEEALQVYNSFQYIFSKWWIILHCLFVIISAYGISYYLQEKGQRFAWLGFAFYSAFGLIEIIRQFLVLGYMKTLRDQYLGTSDASIQQSLRLAMDSFTGVGTALFGGFMLAIMLGNLFTGLAAKGDKSTRLLGIGLLIWAVVLAVGVVNIHFEFAWFDSFIPYFNLSYQPAIRLFLGVTLWKVAASQSLNRIPRHTGVHTEA